MENQLLAHLSRVENEMKKLTPEAAIVFGICCSERQWCAYERASKSKPWEENGVPKIRNCLDSIWSWLIHLEDLPFALKETCQAGIPGFDQLVDGPSVIAHTIANSLADFVSAIEHETPYDARYVSANNVDMIENLKDDLGCESEIDELIALEIDRQNSDIGKLNVAVLSLALVRQLKESSKGVQLFGQLWY